VGFNGVFAFTARVLARVAYVPYLAARADELAVLLDERWDDDRTTWVDAGASADDSGRIRTADALLVVICTLDPVRAARVLGLALDDDAYGGACGPSGVHRDEPAYSPDTYWRGPAWPQLAYLLWVAARRHGLDAHADDLARRARRGATRSGYAEYWDPDDGRGLGAIPQSWTTLTTVMTASDGG
jgi:glycogen debranching enzyme